MTAVEALMNLSSFQTAVRRILEIADSRGDDLRASLVNPTSAPTTEDESSPGWFEAERAFAILYETAGRESLEGVLSDVAGGLKDEPDLENLRRLLRPVEAFDQRVAATRHRDAFLPVLVASSVSLDFRVIPPPQDKILLPVVTVRLSFDESVGGNESIVFQIPIDGLKNITREFSTLSGLIGEISGDIGEYRVPDWAIDG